MSAPKIVFCPNQHIYDASIYSECPYCKKIEQGQKQLEYTLSDAGVQSSSTDIEENHQEDFDLIDEDEDATELLGVNSDKKQDSDELNCECSHVLGWLVCNAGLEEGHSFELNSNTLNLYADTSKYILIKERQNTGRLLATISYSKEKGIFYIEPADGISCNIRRHHITKKEVLKNYDVIRLEEHEFVFVMLIVAFVKWGV